MPKPKENKGITLIALIITIIVLLILAGVTISAISGNESTMEKAKQAKELNDDANETEQIKIAVIGAISEGNTAKVNAENLKNALNGIVPQEEIDKITGNGPWIIKKEEREFFITSDGSVDLVLGKISDLKTVEGQKATELSSANSVVVKDNVGNIVKIPKGFGLSWDTGDYVQDGVVIEDSNTGNQFVWVPVGTIKKATDKTTNPITTTDVTITLGRYQNFTASNGVYTPKQDVSNGYVTTTSDYKISYYYEFKDNTEASDASKIGETDAAITYGNTKAKSLEGFINSANSNGGYYIARYEAGVEGTAISTADGQYSIQNETGTFNTNGLTSDNLTTYVSKLTSKSGKGVWNMINQPNAAILCRNMYTSGVNSDLMNSYSWDTAIIFIQQCANSSYASTSGQSTDTTKPGETGVNTLNETSAVDKQCNIYDMSGNVREWTTECYTSSGNHCVCRGGNYLYTFTTSSRGDLNATYPYIAAGFRPILYL